VVDKKPDIKNVVRVLNRQFSGLSLPIEFALDMSAPDSISVTITRVDVAKTHLCVDILGTGTLENKQRNFAKRINEGLAELAFFLDFASVSFVDLASVDERLLPKIMSMPKSDIKKRFSRTIDSNLWIQELFKGLERSW
jgi:hypothetical protein